MYPNDRVQQMIRRHRTSGVAPVIRRMGLSAAIALVCTVLNPLSVASADQWQPVAVAKFDHLIDVVLSRAGDEVIVVDASSRYRLDFDGHSKASLERLPPTGGDVAAGIIPHASVAVGRRDIRAAWLVSPTSRYRHGILGDAIEAGGLAVEGMNGRRHEFALGKDSVFEDLLPRLHDIDGDKDDEIIVVRSYLQAGAALSVFGLRDDALVRIAEAQPIGRPNRWLNPIGAADFDGDALVELAAVITPHIGGWLAFYRQTGTRLDEVSRWPGYSNHAIGSTALGLATVLDANGDGVLDVVLPAQDRRILKVVTVAGGSFAELQSIRNASVISTSIVSVDLDGNGLKDIIYGLANGSLTMIRR